MNLKDDNLFKKLKNSTKTTKFREIIGGDGSHLPNKSLSIFFPTFLGSTHFDDLFI